MSVVLAVARLGLAAMFIISAGAKLRDRAGSRDAVRAFGVPTALVGTVTAALPLAELGCAALLLAADPYATVGTLGSLALLTAFTAAIVVNLARGRRPACHCFGAIDSSRGISWATVGRNAAFLALAALSLVGASEHPSVPAALATLGGLELAVVALAVALAGAVAAVASLRRSVAGLRGRLDTLERSADPARPITPFTLADLDGATVSLDDVLATGRPALLVAISPACENCAELLPDLLSWQSDPHHPVSVLVLSGGSATDNRGKFAMVGSLRVLLRDAATTLAALGLAGTPGAVLVGPGRRRVDGPAHGADGVRRLHESAVGSLGAGHAPVPPERPTTAPPQPAATRGPGGTTGLAAAAAWGAPAVRVAERPPSATARDDICRDGADCEPG